MIKALRKLRQLILIIDFGSQVTQLIARRVREIGVYAEIHPFDKQNQAINFYSSLNSDKKLIGVILSGGPMSVSDLSSPSMDSNLFYSNIPILGICYGMQVMAKALGGKVESKGMREFGHATVRARGHSLLLEQIFDNVNEEGHGLLDVWMSHGDRVTEIPVDFKVMCSTENCPIAGIANDEKRLYGVQFHPEVTHTKQGLQIIKRFVHEICNATPNWTMTNYIEEAVKNIKQKVGSDGVLLGLSGGVDSSVAATLLQKAIGKQLTCIFVDHGMLRKNESKIVTDVIAKKLGINIHIANASEEFLKGLKGISDPEDKRKIIGKLFVDVFQREAKKIKNVKWLAQGTIYPDVIESADSTSKNTAKIKSHHNVGGLPDTLNLKLLEPLRELFKDEVRKLGMSLGLGADLINRHPFPGPGLAVRILGAIEKEYIEILQKADHIFINKLKNSIASEGDYKNGLCEINEIGKTWYELSSQSFVVFLPVKSVGVMGDGRTYEWTVVLRSVKTSDFMTASWSRLPYDLIQEVSNSIINEVPGINRVAYDVSSKPPATIEWE